MLAFVVIFGVAAAIAFVFFHRSLRFELSAAIFTAVLTAIFLGLVAIAAVHIGALF